MKYVGFLIVFRILYEMFCVSMPYKSVRMSYNVCFITYCLGRMKYFLEICHTAGSVETWQYVVKVVPRGLLSSTILYVIANDVISMFISDVSFQ